MQLNEKKFGIAAAAAMAVGYIICTVFVVLFPALVLKLSGWMFHIVNVEKFAGDINVTVGTFVGGLLQLLLYSFAGAWFFAWMYNRLIKA